MIEHKNVKKCKYNNTYDVLLLYYIILQKFIHIYTEIIKYSMLL